MIDSKTLRRAVVLTAALAACTASSASARVADVPARGGDMTTLATPPAAPPRVDSIGVQPRKPSGAVTVPITQPAHRQGFDWLSAGIAIAALLSLTLLGLAGWSIRAAARAASRRSATP
jgi:hypothetical protein